MRREVVEELLDLGAGSRAEVADNLDDMARLNARFGGFDAVESELVAELVARGLSRAVVLDVAAGAGGLSRRLAARARYCGLELVTVALDRRSLHLGIAWQRAGSGNGHPHHLVVADAAELALGDGSVDAVACTLFLHHLEPASLVRFVQECHRVSRHGFVLADTARAWPPYLFTRLVLPLWMRNRLSRHDAPASVRRGYTAAELAALCAESGVEEARVRQLFPWRLVLSGWKER